MMFGKKEKDPDNFWQEYEEKTGEKVLARSLGRYISGWEEFDAKRWNSIWGLIIATSGGFRFHHFPQQSWFVAITNLTGRDAPKEKTFFIRKDRIVSARLLRESRWWKNLLSPTAPHLIVKYRDGMENEQQLLMEIDYIGRNNNAENMAEILTASDTETIEQP